MKILFVYTLQSIQSTTKPISSWTSIQFGISYISSVLKVHGHQTNLLVLGSEKWNDSISLFQSSIERFCPDIICYTSTSSQYYFIKKIAEFIKRKYPDKFYLIGGVHTSLNPDEVIDGPFNALCIGEGEYPTLELCDQLKKGKEPHGIQNLWIKHRDGKIEKNMARDFIQQLDELPFPDREMWRPWIKETKNNEIALLLGRGCPYNCTYCSNHALRKIAPGTYTRVRSSKNILSELLFIYKNFPIQKIYFEVETIAAKKEWAIDLCSKITEFNKTINNDLSYVCNFRISKNSIDEKLFSAFNKANFHRINIGLESGSERVRREVLKRTYSNQEFLAAVSMARKYGLAISVYNMIGLPGESLAEHMETVALNRQCQPKYHYTGIFFPYPGTELYSLCIKNGLIKESINNTMERKESVLDIPNFSKSQIQQAYVWFDYRVYKGYKSNWLLLLKVVKTKIISNAFTEYIYRKIVQLPILNSIRIKLGDR